MTTGKIAKPLILNSSALANSAEDRARRDDIISELSSEEIGMVSGGEVDYRPEFSPNEGGDHSTHNDW